jgi:hypothetical protein
MANPQRRSVSARPLAAPVLAAFTAILFGGRLSMAGSEQPNHLERETREFKVSVDGIGRGTCTMQIRCWDDGSVSVRSETEVSVNLLVYRYKYSNSGNEVWKKGRLISLDSTADYNGTPYVVKAVATRKGLDVTVDGHTSQLDANTWVTSYWQIPERLLTDERPQPKGGLASALGPLNGPAEHSVTLLDSDQGRTLKGKLQRLGESVFDVAGKRRTCSHYRIVGDVQAELWFDESGRLVWEESKESGHKVRLEVSRIAAE